MTRFIRSIASGLSIACTVFLGYALSAGSTVAQDFPNREIKIAVGFPAGGGADVIARYFAEALRPLAGVTVLVENRSGAGGNIAVEGVVKSKPDGYSLVISSGGPASYNVHLFKRLGYDPVADLAPISPLVSFPFVLIVSGKSPINSVPDLVAHLKARGDKATYAAVGGSGIVMGELMKRAAGVEAASVLYRNTQASVNDLLDGSLDFTFMEPTVAIEQARAGRLKALAVSTPKRSSAMPELPTMIELGYPTVERMSWFGLFAPAGTPAPIVTKLNGWVQAILATDATKQFFRNVVTDTFPGSPEDLARLQKDEIAKWAELVKIANIEPQ
jgi:tripartite-type tricarboxylate transporter receptor subunit TctC